MKFQITKLAACLDFFFLTHLLRGHETKEFKLIQLEKLINTFTDLEVKNNPLKRNGVNLEILNTKIKEPEEIWILNSYSNPRLLTMCENDFFWNVN